ncbi:hypothetical protein K505DRAFT_360154 [Melanomma pulvis-pyrius CBS 109.77]|uniref:Uncharacterized protein n=1 Tax=Melanomma pulvis-pyrius CBS 109.77 TaxID=1314802 RepID=A0A6A6XIK1_9PLEO|nr:hypothetical protein K505DRAFT_360154 [Melanomma pulvis-pyrius CBS 109.77]
MEGALAGSIHHNQAPDELRHDLPLISELLKSLRPNYTILKVPVVEPITVDEDNLPESSTAANTPRPTALNVNARRTAAGGKIEVKVAKLSMVCREMAKKLSSIYLCLQSRPINETGEPDSDVRTDGRKRDNKTVTIQHEVSIRLLESSVADALQRDSMDANTPRKKACLAILDHHYGHRRISSSIEASFMWDAMDDICRGSSKMVYCIASASITGGKTMTINNSLDPNKRLEHYNNLQT